MARKPEIPDITLGEALAFIKDKAQKELLWRSKAAQLLATVGNPEIDANRIKDLCSAHAQEAENL